MSLKQIILDEMDFVFMAAYLGEGQLIGVDDPFLGWLAHSVQEEWERRLPDMVKHEYLIPNQEDGYHLSPEMEIIIRLCCSPSRWSMVRMKETGTDEITLHILMSKNGKSIVLEYKKPSVCISFCDSTDNDREENEITGLDLNSAENDHIEMSKNIADILHLSPEKITTDDFSAQEIRYDEYEDFIGKIKDLNLDQKKTLFQKTFPLWGSNGSPEIICEPKYRFLITTVHMEDETEMSMVSVHSSATRLIKLQETQHQNQSMIRIDSCSSDDVVQFVLNGLK